MAGTNLNLPYDAEIFNESWKSAPDLVLTNMLSSGAVVRDPEIERLISTGSNYFTTPYFDLIGGDEEAYDGSTGFTHSEISGGTYSGVVYSRKKSWLARSFVKDFNNADAMDEIVSGVAQYWNKKRQARLLGILEALFGIAGDADFTSGHTYNIAHAGNAQSEKATGTSEPTADGDITVTVTSARLATSPKSVTVAILNADTLAGVATKIATALNNDATISAVFTATTDTASVILTADTIASFDSTLAISFTDTGTTGYVLGASVDNTASATISDTNLIGETTVEDACVKANGDNAGGYSLAIMHSTVANRLAKLQLLNYLKYTDAMGIQRDLPIGTINGKTVIINDEVTTVGSPVNGYYEYTTYLLGSGAIRYAQAPVEHPSDMKYDPDLYGGADIVYTRLREALVPYGFTFIGSTTANKAILDNVLLSSASYSREIDAKALFIARIVTNG